MRVLDEDWGRDDVVWVADIVLLVLLLLLVPGTKVGSIIVGGNVAVGRKDDVAL